jgi:phosphate transport system permease protein
MGRIARDRLAGNAMFLLSTACVVLLCAMAAGLVIKSYPILKANSLVGLFLSDTWRPLRGEFGMLAFITGTIWVTGLAMIIAVPLSLFSAVYLSEYARPWLRKTSRPLIDLLAGIPSVVYGLWGILFIVPLVRDRIAPLFEVHSSGYSILSAAMVLAVMVLPIIIHITMEVLQSIPRELRDAALSLGATRWQTVKLVLLRRAFPGIMAANVLGLSRAFGETMAVLMVAGNIAAIPASPFDPGYPLPALIANNYGEMLSVPLYDSALMLAALTLFIVVIAFNILSRYVLNRINLRIS